MTYNDDFFIQYAIDELNGKHKRKESKKLVRCRNCKHCQFDRIGEFECLKQCAGTKSVLIDGYIEYVLSRNQWAALRHCDCYDYDKNLDR